MNNNNANKVDFIAKKLENQLNSSVLEDQDDADSCDSKQNNCFSSCLQSSSKNSLFSNEEEIYKNENNEETLNKLLNPKCSSNAKSK